MGFLRRWTRRELVRDGALAAGTLVLPEAAFTSSTAVPGFVDTASSVWFWAAE